MAKTLSVRVSDNVYDRLNQISKKTMRPKSFYLNEMLQLYIDEFEDAYLAWERLNDINTTYYTSSEVRKKLGI
ncbi:MAG: ribbon-helix-helix domain-containing protein [Nitrospirae bacterium]|nr:ribbon-helix-helix domain-containing protein [Nitrospirota bacterium]MBF0521361.1 ribbon-helix-helix domain-containing protein [Nitrospirota bacterium]MBF0535975.1 ribbon-helix-helix domain-containing protein [Nitrospirota bacterium]MBF0618048.1 ribbon-helix-helix domain-containing protein [Nitrospirota bacterium]